MKLAVINEVMYLDSGVFYTLLRWKRPDVMNQTGRNKFCIEAVTKIAYTVVSIEYQSAGIRARSEGRTPRPHRGP